MLVYNEASIIKKPDVTLRNTVMKKQTLGAQFIEFFVSMLQSENPESKVIVSDPDNFQFAVIPSSTSFPLNIEIHQLHTGETGEYVDNFDSILGLIQENTYTFDNESEIIERCKEIGLGDDYLTDDNSDLNFMEVALVTAEMEDEKDTLFMLPSGLDTEYETAVTILSNGLAQIEQNSDCGTETDPLTESLSGYQDAISSSLMGNFTKSEILDKLADNISDITGFCVLSFNIDTESLLYPE